jgi:hypothetical protein
LVYAYINKTWPFTSVEVIEREINKDSSEDMGREIVEGRVSILYPQEGSVFFPGDQIEIRALIEGDLYERSLDSFFKLDSVFLRIGKSAALFEEGEDGFPESLFVTVSEDEIEGSVYLILAADNSVLMEMPVSQRISSPKFERISLNIMPKTQVESLIINLEGEEISLSDDDSQLIKERQITVFADFGDIGTRDITKSTGNVYIISDEDVISVDERGLITPKSVGISTVKVVNRGLESLPVSIRVVE